MLHLYIITCQSCVYFQKLHHICVPWHFQNKLLWNGTVFCIHLINTNATFITGTLMKRVTELGEGNFSTESEPGAGRTCPSARAVCRQVCPGAEAGAGGLGQTRSGRRGERQRAARGCVQSARPCTAGSARGRAGRGPRVRSESSLVSQPVGGQPASRGRWPAAPFA